MNDLILRAQQGEMVAMNELMEKNAGLVWSIVKRFAGRGYEKEDLFQIGSLGFIKAVKRFDVNLRTAIIHLCCFYDFGRNQALFAR